MVERSKSLGERGVASELVERRTNSHDMMNKNVVVAKKQHKDFLETTLMADTVFSAMLFL